MQGSYDYLDSVIGLEIDVEFVELYKGQPLFNEVDGLVMEEIKGFDRFAKYNYSASITTKISPLSLRLVQPRSSIVVHCLYGLHCNAVSATAGRK